MARLTYITPLVLGALALAGCPGDDGGQTSETDASTGTTGPAPTTTTDPTVDPDSTTGDPDPSTTTGDPPPMCEPACEGDEPCCVEGLCFPSLPPACDPPCEGDFECQYSEGEDACNQMAATECVDVSLCQDGWGEGSYDQCINDAGEPDSSLCPAGSICIQGPDNQTTCSAQECTEQCDCPEPPDSGDATVTCGSVTNDEINDCYLSCENDETCPAGMTCLGDTLCVFAIPLPQSGYRNCSHTGFTCQIGEDCLQDGDMMTPSTWAVCSQPGCTTEMDCSFEAPSSGDAPVTCGDPTGGMGADRCYLDCAMGQTCPDGMSCRDGSWCAWDAGTTLFYDDFQTADFSAGWTITDVDMQTPNMQVDFINDAWIVSDVYDGGGGSNLAAYSHSYYTPAGQSDDWMISPQIMIGPNARVEWFSRAQDPNFPDGFEVRVSTAGTDVMDFDPMPIFSIPNEAATGDYIYHSVDLAAAGYADEQIHLAWRNNSTDEFVLLVDDIAVVDFP